MKKILLLGTFVISAMSFANSFSEKEVKYTYSKDSSIGKNREFDKFENNPKTIKINSDKTEKEVTYSTGIGKNREF